MTVKKWRPLWSYDLEKTEGWLADMAAEGQHLTAMNRLTRMFTFTSGDAEKANYQVIYDKSESGLPKGLENAGWEVAASDLRWKFAKNSLADIVAFPSREAVWERNRVHRNVLTGLTFLYIGPLVISFLLLLMGLPGGEPNIFWLVGALFIGQMIFFCRAQYLCNQYRKSDGEEVFEGVYRCH